MSNELSVKEAKSPILVGSRGIEFKDFDGMWRFALAVSRSGLAPKGVETPEAIVVVMQHGAEIGLSPMQALQNISPINGRPSVWGDAALAIVMAHPHFVDIEESFENEGTDKVAAICTIKRKNQTPVTRRFTLDDARKADLLGKDNYRKFLKRMLQCRARSWTMKDSFPDALKGIHITDEFDSFTEKNITPSKSEGRGAATVELPPEPEISTPPIETHTEVVSETQTTQTKTAEPTEYERNEAKILEKLDALNEIKYIDFENAAKKMKLISGTKTLASLSDKEFQNLVENFDAILTEIK